LHPLAITIIAVRVKIQKLLNVPYTPSISAHRLD
jgi:hypothetical protein